MIIMVFESLNPELQKIIQKRFKQPTLPQQLAIPAILSGLNVLAIAETGTGKTESALLGIFDRIIKELIESRRLLKSKKPFYSIHYTYFVFFTY